MHGSCGKPSVLGPPLLGARHGLGHSTRPGRGRDWQPAHEVCPPFSGRTAKATFFHALTFCWTNSASGMWVEVTSPPPSTVCQLDQQSGTPGPQETAVPGALKPSHRRPTQHPVEPQGPNENLHSLCHPLEVWGHLLERLASPVPPNTPSPDIGGGPDVKRLMALTVERYGPCLRITRGAWKTCRFPGPDPCLLNPEL